LLKLTERMRSFHAVDLLGDLNDHGACPVAVSCSQVFDAPKIFAARPPALFALSPEVLSFPPLAAPMNAPIAAPITVPGPGTIDPITPPVIAPPAMPMYEPAAPLECTSLVSASSGPL
jgi:hypothetical protein